MTSSSTTTPPSASRASAHRKSEKATACRWQPSILSILNFGKVQASVLRMSSSCNRSDVADATLNSDSNAKGIGEHRLIPSPGVVDVEA
eukprot:CAMPEP_0181243920 /NCGR_PEP_ID=MMETSP1096-20121128/42553_1 /TAXON_ID=156174 ORGANISM="Chrysochromulina ericina, Strain CCMP281" /NCGR_SAMPLE_ID=MMETSP1096 /ASSEMBLY_ACC=CAM_ASM_000453 /LENGTH=88 /DNA_ID=CAMNT_0023340373 /DNA_START=829 /DNA_END=1095 /DNA_ORIENTATION=-